MLNEVKQTVINYAVKLISHPTVTKTMSHPWVTKAMNTAFDCHGQVRNRVEQTVRSLAEWLPFFSSRNNKK